jgi:hypothetical protein
MIRRQDRTRCAAFKQEERDRQGDAERVELALADPDEQRGERRRDQDRAAPAHRLAPALHGVGEAVQEQARGDMSLLFPKAVVDVQGTPRK